MNVQVLKVDGTTITDEVLATATATAEDVVLFDGTTSMGRIMFNFMEVDEFGFPSQVPLELGDCAFALAINGVDKEMCIRDRLMLLPLVFISLKEIIRRWKSGRIWHWAQTFLPCCATGAILLPASRIQVSFPRGILIFLPQRRVIL